jgi:protein PET100, fungi type
MYVMFPIGIMYYFGTNLDSRFSVPDFWPKAEHSHKVPFDRDEISAELERLRTKRLMNRERRLATEGQAQQNQNQSQQEDQS